MLADVDETLRTLLEAELPVRNSEIEIQFDQPRREWSARLNRPTVNLYLYDLRENAALRQHQWERQPDGNGRPDLARFKRTPLRVDCAYMLTAWASDPEDEHNLLARCLLALFRYPVLPRERLAGSLRDQPYEVKARLAQHDRLTNPAEVWGALDNELRPSVSYILTLALDPWTEVSGPLVRTLRLRSGQAGTLPQVPGLSEDTRSERVEIGGTLRSREQGGAPLPGVEVAIKGTGLFATTDERGRFTLGVLPPGKYTLVAWTGRARPLERSIQVPGGEYDLEAE